jgi:hypothetical protein
LHKHDVNLAEIGSGAVVEHEDDDVDGSEVEGEELEKICAVLIGLETKFERDLIGDCSIISVSSFVLLLLLLLLFLA